MRRVRRVESLRPELNPHSFTDHEVFGQVEVEIAPARTVQDVAPTVPVGEIRRQRESGKVEPSRNALLALRQVALAYPVRMVLIGNTACRIAGSGIRDVHA